jgi:hypothetical protein
MVCCCNNGGREGSDVGGEWVLVYNDAETSGFNAMLPRKEEQWREVAAWEGGAKGARPMMVVPKMWGLSALSSIEADGTAYLRLSNKLSVGWWLDRGRRFSARGLLHEV